MDAGELRKHIALVESYNQGISEVDATRRGLFKSAAALAAVAALPQQVKHQAADLISSFGMDLTRAIAAVKEAGLKSSHFEWVSYLGRDIDEDIDILHPFPDRVRAMEVLTGTKLPGLADDPKRRYTYNDMLPGNPAYEREERRLIRWFNDMDLDGRMREIDRAWKALGLGDNPYAKAYQLGKRFPDLEEMAQTMLSDFIPEFDDQLTVPPAPGQGLASLHQSLKYYRDQEQRHSEDGDDDLADQFRQKRERVEYLIRQYHAVSGGPIPSRAAAPAPRSAPPTGTGGPGTILRAAMAMLNAFRSDDLVTKVGLERLKDIKPEDVKVTMQQDSGPEEPKPATLPAPGPGIDIGLDRQPAGVLANKND